MTRASALGSAAFARQRHAEGFDHPPHVARLRRQAQAGDTELAQGGQFADQVVDAGGLGLDAVQGEEGLAFAGVQGEAVW